MTALADRVPGVAPIRGRSELTGTGSLIRFIFRRDRVRLTVWTLSLVFTYFYFVTVLHAMGQEALNARGEVMSTPAGILMGGPGFGVGDGLDYTVGIAMANEMILWVTIALALQAILHIVRHTRAEEETSRSELVRASVVGRHAPAFAAFLSLVAMQVVVAVVGALGMYGANPNLIPLGDAFGMTFGVAAAALAFGAFTVIACQLTEHPRGATGLGIAFLGLMYVLRAAGDMQGAAQDQHGSALSWASPIGWAQQMAPFYALRWWPALLSLGLTAVLLLGGSLLAARRDFGAGMLGVKPGRADARTSLRSPFALAWRQQRTSFIAWFVGMVAVWGATGTLLPDIAEMGREGMLDNEIFAQIFGGLDPASAAQAFAAEFLNVMGLFIALIFAAYAISTFARIRGEETSGRLEQLLGAPRSRSRVLGAQLAVTAIGTAAMTIASMAVMWVGANSAGMGTPGLGRYLLTGVVYLAAIAAFIGLAAVLYAWVPGKVQWAWVLVAYSFVFGVFGGVFGAPEWVQWVNPLYWAPAVFTGELHRGGLVGLCVAAVVLFGVAFAGFRRRDVPVV